MSSDPLHLWPSIDQVYLAVNRHLIQQLHLAGFVDLRPAHSKVFEHLGGDDATVTVLAERAHMTKQAMGELVIDLERRGYLRRVPDARDQRAKLVVLTPRGEAAVASAVAALTQMHALVDETVGSAGLAAAADVLARVVQVLSSTSAEAAAASPPGARASTSS